MRTWLSVMTGMSAPGRNTTTPTTPFWRAVWSITRRTTARRTTGSAAARLSAASPAHSGEAFGRSLAVPGVREGLGHHIAAAQDQLPSTTPATRGRRRSAPPRTRRTPAARAARGHDSRPRPPGDSASTTRTAAPSVAAGRVAGRKSSTVRTSRQALTPSADVCRAGGERRGQLRQPPRRCPPGRLLASRSAVAPTSASILTILLMSISGTEAPVVDRELARADGCSRAARRACRLVISAAPP